jgi:hypothetical protein
MSVGLPTNSPPPSPAGLPLVTQSSAAIAIGWAASASKGGCRRRCRGCDSESLGDPAPPVAILAPVGDLQNCK